MYGSSKTRFSDITDTAKERSQQNLAGTSKCSKLKAIKKKKKENQETSGSGRKSGYFTSLVSMLQSALLFID